MLDYGFAVSDRITKALPPDVMGKGVTLKDIFNEDHKRYGDGAEFRALHEQDADVRTIYQTALGLEGQIRNWGVHAAGVIMSSEPLVDIVPIMARPQDGAVITQFDYPMCEALGLVKMDFLGLSNLHTPRGRAGQHQGQPRRGGRPRGAAVRRPGDLRADGPRRHPRRVPARRRRHAGAAALDAARPVRRHHRRLRALPPGPDGCRLPQQVRPPQERPRADRCRSTPRSPTRSSRCWGRPTA